MARLAVFSARDRAPAGGRPRSGAACGGAGRARVRVPARAPAPRRRRLDPARFAGRSSRSTPRTSASAVRAARRALPGRPVGRPRRRPRRRARCAGSTASASTSWSRPGGRRTRCPRPCSPTCRARGARRRAAAARAAPAPQTTARRLAILTDVVKTANSILEPRKVIELVVEKIRQLIPSEAWSLLMVDEEKQELVFEAALGAKGARRRRLPPEDRGGRRGLGGADAASPRSSTTPRATRASRARVDTRTQFETRSILCAPLVSRGRTIGVLEIINKLGGRFTRARPRARADPRRAVRDRDRERDPLPAHRAAHDHGRPHAPVQLALPEPLPRPRDQALQAPRDPALA